MRFDEREEQFVRLAYRTVPIFRRNRDVFLKACYWTKPFVVWKMCIERRDWFPWTSCLRGE